MAKAPPPLDLEDAERMALSALTFLAEDATRLGRFLALTGIGPDELRSGAGARATQAAVLEHLMADESLLLVFAATKSVAPQSIPLAHALLAQDGRRSRLP